MSNLRNEHYAKCALCELGNVRTEHYANSAFMRIEANRAISHSVVFTVVTHQSPSLQEHDRAPGRVIFLSGASGRPLGRYLEIPNSRETYMSVVRHVTANGSSYILFGSGGETVSGEQIGLVKK